MMLRGPALAAAFAAIAVIAGANAAPPDDGDVERCGLPSPAESIAAARALAASRAAAARRPEPPMTTASLRARAGAYANYAASNRRTQPDTAALALLLEAQIYLRLGLPDSALAPARASVALAPRGGTSEARAHATLGEVQQSRGHPESALAHYDSAFRAITRPEQVAERGQLCTDIGNAHQELGALDRARDYLTRALALRKAIGDSAGVGVTLNNIGRLQQTIGRPDASLQPLERAVEVLRALGDSVGVAAALATIGYAYDLMKQPERALEAYNGSRAALRPIQNRSYQGLALLNIGRAHLALGRFDAARDDVLAGRELKRLAGDSAGVSWAYHDLGRAEVALRNLDAGLALLDTARRAMHRVGDRSREGSALYFAGVARQHAGGDANLREAVAAYAQAMDARLDVGRTAGNDADRVMFAEQDVSLTSKWVLAWLARAGVVGADSAARASLAAAERGRARALLDLLQRNGQQSSAEPLSVATARVRAPSISYLVTPNAIVAWLSLPDGSVRSACQRIARDQLDTLVSRARAHLWADQPGASHVIERVSTMLGDPSDDTPADCAPLAVSIDDATTRTQDGVLAALSRLLLPARLMSQLPDSGELVIVPHAQLSLIPFAALPVRKPAAPLGLRYAVRYAPSLAMLGAVDAIAPRAVDGARALVVADPAMPRDPDGNSRFEALPGARATAEWLSSTLHMTGFLKDAEPTVRVVRERMPGAALVHLGTHGRAYSTEARARDSFIALAGDDSTALLRVSDVLALPPLNAELVVLMACETGLGDLKESEGTSGLQRAFLARGARSVLVSLWRVDREASDSLIRSFYRHWLAGGAKSGKAEALRRAQRDVVAWRRAKDTTEKNVNPYYWAGFQIVGAQ